MAAPSDCSPHRLFFRRSIEGTTFAYTHDMNKDIHAAALRAASKVAFSVAFLAGCSTGSADADDNANPPPQESEVKSGAACNGKKFTCDHLVKAAFPTHQNYPGQAVQTSNEVKACCTEILKTNGAQTEYRWECCANRAGAQNDQDVNIACTPWGPPVPPAMKRVMKRVMREEASIEVV
jgi:hypothetical protein